MNTQTHTCSHCKTVNARELKDGKNPRLPGGWKRPEGEDGGILCDKCYKKLYYTFAVTLPVAGPANTTDQKQREAWWKQFRETLYPMWRQTTQATNLVFRELFLAENSPGTKQGKTPLGNLYMMLRETFPDIPSASCAAIENETKKKFAAIKSDVWRGNVSLPTVKYPQPLPIRAQEIVGGFRFEGPAPVVRLKLGENHFDIGLKYADKNYRRMIASLKKVANNLGFLGAGQIIMRSKDKAVMFKLVVNLKREEKQIIPDAEKITNANTLSVRTGEKSLIFARSFADTHTKDEPLWTYNADHLRRLARAHDARTEGGDAYIMRTIKRYNLRRQRLGQDTKAESRKIRRHLTGTDETHHVDIAAHRDKMTQKHHDRMDDIIKQAAASLVKYAIRRKFLSIVYDDSCTDFATKNDFDFPYFRLANRIQTLANQNGILFTKVDSAAKTTA